MKSNLRLGSLGNSRSDQLFSIGNSKFNHWQLRDLILSPDINKRKFIYVNQMSVNWFNIDTQTVNLD